MAEALKSHEIARAAAEGVAIALSARDASYSGPFHLICGRPPADLFEVIIGGDAGALRTMEVNKQAS